MHSAHLGQRGGDSDGKGREGAIDGDGKGAHPCTPGSEGETAGGRERGREGDRKSVV